MQSRLFYFLIVLFLSIGIKTKAQVHEGGYVNFGIAFGTGHWAQYDRLFQEYNSLRPWLTEKAELQPSRYGFSINGGGSLEKLNIDFGLSGFKTSIATKGIDSSGIELERTFILKTRGFDMNYGYFLYNGENFRIGASFGLAFSNVVLRYTDESKAHRIATSALRMLFLLNGGNVHDVDDHLWFGSKFQLFMAFGESKAFGIAPFYTLPFWQINVKSTRDELNPNTTSLFPDKAFKSSLSYYGIRFSMAFGTN